MERATLVRPELLEPLMGNKRYDAARKLVRRIYRLIDRGQDCSEPLARLSKVVRKRLSRMELEEAAELIEPQVYAFELIADRVSVPADLSESEMLELLERILADNADGVQLGYWTRCLEINTGDRRISTLIQSPELYFGDTSRAQRLTAREILATARGAGKQEDPGQD